MSETVATRPEQGHRVVARLAGTRRTPRRPPGSPPAVTTTMAATVPSLKQTRPATPEDQIRWPPPPAGCGRFGAIVASGGRSPPPGGRSGSGVRRGPAGPAAPARLRRLRGRPRSPGPAAPARRTAGRSPTRHRRLRELRLVVGADVGVGVGSPERRPRGGRPRASGPAGGRSADASTGRRSAAPPPPGASAVDRASASATASTSARRPMLSGSSRPRLVRLGGSRRRPSSVAIRRPRRRRHASTEPSQARSGSGPAHGGAPSPQCSPTSARRRPRARWPRGRQVEDPGLALRLPGRRRASPARSRPGQHRRLEAPRARPPSRSPPRARSAPGSDDQGSRRRLDDSTSRDEDRGHLAGRRLGPVRQLGPATARAIARARRRRRGRPGVVRRRRPSPRIGAAPRSGAAGRLGADDPDPSGADTPGARRVVLARRLVVHGPPSDLQELLLFVGEQLVDGGHLLVGELLELLLDPLELVGGDATRPSPGPRARGGRPGAGCGRPPGPPRPCAGPPSPAPCAAPR